MKTRKKWPVILLACVGVVLCLGLALRGDGQKQLVMDYAQSELDWMDRQGQREPGFFSTHSMISARPFIEVGAQEIPEELSYSGVITCALYGFVEDVRVKSVTLHTYVGGELRSVEGADWLPTFSREILVVETSFHVDVPNGDTLACTLEVVTDDGLCYHHTALEMDGYNIHSDTKTEVYTEAGEYLRTLGT